MVGEPVFLKRALRRSSWAELHWCSDLEQLLWPWSLGWVKRSMGWVKISKVCLLRIGAQMALWLAEQKKARQSPWFLCLCSTFQPLPSVPPCKNLKWTLSNWSGLIKIPSLPFINSDGKSQIFWLPRAKEESLCGLSQHNMGRGGRVI